VHARNTLRARVNNSSANGPIREIPKADPHYFAKIGTATTSMTIYHLVCVHARNTLRARVNNSFLVF
jgi:hypothetical protein